MKFSAILLAATAAGLAAAQTLEDYVPECSRPCLLEAQSSATDCKEGDLPCFCINHDAIYGAAASCVLSMCSIARAGELLHTIDSICDAE